MIQNGSIDKFDLQYSFSIETAVLQSWIAVDHSIFREQHIHKVDRDKFRSSERTGETYEGKGAIADTEEIIQAALDDTADVSGEQRALPTCLVPIVRRIPFRGSLTTKWRLESRNSSIVVSTLPSTIPHRAPRQKMINKLLGRKMIFWGNALRLADNRPPFRIGENS
jgi:hypothetical protein